MISFSEWVGWGGPGWEVGEIELIDSIGIELGLIGTELGNV